LLSNSDLKKEWLIKRKVLFDSKVNVSEFLVWFIENYPESAKIMKENPDYQYKFK